MAVALAAAGDSAYVGDLRAGTLAWAGASAELFGGAPPATLAALAELVHADDRTRRRDALDAHLCGDQPLDCDFRLRLADGTVHWVHDRGMAERDAHGTPWRLCGVLRVGDRRRGEEAERIRRAQLDHLTDLVDRQHLWSLLEGGGMPRAGRPALLVAGVDKLGLINETLGHAAGNAVLTEVARRLAVAARPGDTVARIGGDLFAVLLPDCPEPHLPGIAERLLTAIRSEPMATAAGPVHVTVSVGGATVTGGGDATLARAESALHEAKRQGRDGFWPHHATSPQQTALRDSAPVGQMVRAALHDGELRFAFQPVVDAEGYVSYYECLLRIAGPDGSVRAAGEFMPAVERLSMARRIDRHTLALAVRELDLAPKVRLALNVSAATTADGSWLAALHGAIGTRPDLAERLIVEITETAAIEDLNETARFIGIVRALGCRVALDDFGAGYLSYRHLKALPVDIVKIDGSFVREMDEGPDALRFIRTLLTLSEGFGLSTVAEGVETAAHAAVLRREGVRLLQGNHFGAPSLRRPWLDAPLAAE